MLKAIFAKHVKKGDEIFISGGRRVTVLDVEELGSTVRLHIGGGYLNCAEYEIVGLGHRPYAKGKTEEDMQESVMHCVRSVDRIPFGRSGIEPVKITLRREIEVLGKIIEEYELGKPEVKR
jgi:preprotein translocase subunit YajC